MNQRAIVTEQDRARAPGDESRRRGRLMCEQPCTVTVSVGGSIIEATLADLSCFGMMATTPVAMLPRAFVDIALPGGGRATGQVCWCRDGAFGVEFSVPLAARTVGTILQRHGARPMRLAVWAPVRLTARGNTRSVVLRDISDGGMQLAGTDNMTSFTRVAVELAPDITLEGTVRWSRDGRTGIEFDEVLSPEVRDWVSLNLMSRC
jgi:hypothetical protein